VLQDGQGINAIRFDVQAIAMGTDGVTFKAFAIAEAGSEGSTAPSSPVRAPSFLIRLMVRNVLRMERAWMGIANVIRDSLALTVASERAPTIAFMAFARDFSASANKAGVVTHVLGICVNLAAADTEDAKTTENANARMDMMAKNASTSCPVPEHQFAVEEENAWKLSANAKSHSLARLVKSKFLEFTCV